MHLHGLPIFPFLFKYLCLAQDRSPPVAVVPRRPFLLLICYLHYARMNRSTPKFLIVNLLAAPRVIVPFYSLFCTQITATLTYADMDKIKAAAEADRVKLAAISKTTSSSHHHKSAGHDGKSAHEHRHKDKTAVCDYGSL